MPRPRLATKHVFDVRVTTTADPAAKPSEVLAAMRVAVEAAVKKAKIAPVKGVVVRAVLNK